MASRSERLCRFMSEGIAQIVPITSMATCCRPARLFVGQDCVRLGLAVETDLARRIGRRTVRPAAPATTRVVATTSR
jgi:hypothetical protein